MELLKRERAYDGSLKLNNILAGICALYLSVWSVFPAIQLGNVFRFAALGCALLWFFLINSKRNYFMDRKDAMMLFFVLMVIVVAIISNMGFGGVMSQISIYMLFIGYYMAKYYEKRDDSLTFITVTVIAILIFSNVRTFIALSEDDHLMRAMVRDDENTYSYLLKGIGGYGLIYPQVCIAPLFLSWTISAFKKNKFCFILGLVWAISYVLLVLNSGYFISIVVSVIGLVLTLARSKKSLFYSLFISVGIMLALYFLIANSDGFRTFLLETFKGSNSITFKINDIYDSYWGIGDAHNVRVRLDAYLQSIKSIFTYPILGGFWGAITGGHSTILDIVAIYGWFGGYALITMVLHVPVTQKKMTKDVYIKKIANAVITTMLIVAFLDNFAYQIMTTVTVISLGLFKDIKKWREKT